MMMRSALIKRADTRADRKWVNWLAARTQLIWPLNLDHCTVTLSYNDSGEKKTHIPYNSNIIYSKCWFWWFVITTGGLYFIALFSNWLTLNESRNSQSCDLSWLILVTSQKERHKWRLDDFPKHISPFCQSFRVAVTYEGQKAFWKRAL